MNEPIETILAECLRALQMGEADVETCLRRYPDRREELEPVLRAWDWVQSAPAEIPSMKFQQEAHDQLLSKLGQQENPKKAKAARRPLLGGMRWAMAAVGVLFAVMVSGAGVAYASEGALPGDALYSAKTAIEGVRLAFADSEGDVSLFNEFANRRVEEMQALVAAGRPEDLPAAAQGYENAMRGMANALSEVEEEDEDKAKGLATTLAEAHERRTEVLNGLLGTAPEAALKGLQRALEAGPPEGKGKPEDKGKPENPGCPEKGGPPEGKGRPDSAGPPEDSNAPEDAGPPEDRCGTDEGTLESTETPEGASE